MAEVANIHNTVTKIFKRAEREKLPTIEIADRIALERIQEVQKEKIEKMKVTELAI
ncbi:MAG: hypothetical protein JKX94_00115 [Sneathiella sp.]|nr:hypothetical protein [Sneathiella sp.]